MKDYKQVTDSVFKKAEQRIAEKKRRTAIIRRNAIAASGMAAALLIVLLQNDDIRSALRSLPKLASSGWSDHESKSSHSTTAAITSETSTKKHITTAKTTSSESTTTTSTTTETTTTETTTTTTAERTAAPVTEAAITVTTTVQPTTSKPSKIKGKPLIYIGDWSDTVKSATSDVIELENGMRIGLEYGAIDYRNKFKAGDEIKYNANYVYDNNDDIYYYVDGYIDYDELRNGHLHFSEYITETDNEPYKEYYNFDDPYEEVFDGAIFTDYNTILSYPNFSFKEQTVYKIEARNIKIIESPYSHFIKTEDGQEWYLSQILNLSDEQVESISPGDTISFAGYFMHHDYDNSLSSLAIVIKKEK